MYSLNYAFAIAPKFGHYSAKKIAQQSFNAFH